MSSGIFITATGTDVGKTYVSGVLLKRLRALNINAGYFKAALSGATEGELKELIPGDAKYVYDVAGIVGDFNDSITYILKTEASPHLAAEIEGVEINLDTIKNHFKNHTKNYEFILTEGSGGIICPISINGERLMLTDVIRSLNLDIIIVADAGLGTINSTLLTVEYAKSLGIKIKGIILNKFNEDNFIHKDNLNMIKDFTKLPIYVCEENGNIKISDAELLKMVGIKRKN